MYYFGDFGATYLFLDAVFPYGSPYIFKNMYIPHCYKIANTPILQSRIDVAISSNSNSLRL